LKLSHDDPLPNFAFNFSLRPYSVESVKERGRITADLRANRKTGNRDKGEFWQGGL